MAPPGIVFLMYHELELAGRSLAQAEPGYVRYILREPTFRSQIDWLRKNGWHGLSVTEALQYPSEKSVALTFDDGCETDLITAAPILLQAGFHATFYVTTGFLDKPSYMSTAQLRQLSDLGLEIGCHSMTHPYLDDIGADELRREVVDARLRLQDVTGSAVDHFSCPGGRYDERTVTLAKQTGYRSLATSRVHMNFASTDTFALGRVPVMRATGLTDFENICGGTILWKMRLSETVRGSARKLLGNSFYDRVRDGLLGRA
jgi:peptidoglycan/xylan/chitin deacetylase (PgdA/CDA1 family)